MFNGTFNSVGAAKARGECRLQQDGQALNGAAIRVEPGIHVDPGSPAADADKDYGDGYGINIVTTPQGGKHTYSVACNEFSGRPEGQAVPALRLHGPLGEPASP